MIAQAIKKIAEKKDLTRQETFEAVGEIMGGEASEAQIAAFLVGLRVKGETAEEITGGVQSLLAAANRITPGVAGCVDIVGTGGDCTGTFNISSTAALVAAGAGACVAKHGNRSVSSQSGSADLFEALGLDLALTPSEARQCLETHGFTFLFAPVYHPAMRHAAPVRRQLGVRSLFNLLGPLANPAGPSSMLIGVCDPALLAYMAETLKTLGVRRALVVSGRDGTDEISLAEPTDYCELKDGLISRGVMTPEQFGLNRACLAAVGGGTPAANARLAEAILAGQAGAPRDIVLLNAAVTLYLSDVADSIDAGLAMARQSIDSGAARQKLAAVRQVRHLPTGGEQP
jgi:anthranilate phosphoribosyltransferase